MTTNEKLMLLDEYLEEPNSIDPRWEVMLLEYRRMLTEQWAGGAE